MTQQQNEFGQPIGFALTGWTPPPLPPRETLTGRYCRVEPLDAERHAAQLHEANSREPDGRGWTYVAYGPFATLEDYRHWVETYGQRNDHRFCAIIDVTSGKAAGVASYMRMDPANGSIEVGGIKYTPLIARRPSATEAMYLMMKQVFALGYRRYEWKCDALNAPSRAAALRLGFSYEGTFRQAVVYKNRNRDTAWFSISDRDWPALQAAHEQWLAPENFDAQGHQIVSLSGLTAPLLQARG
ncbi:MAG: GNAT family protein [Burkholderiales bacterium]|nr:GNAT family protein [Burkholderiales bacterium]